MRVIVLYILVGGFAIYAWKNWFVSLCALIVMMAVMNRADMPRSIAGIQGLSLWNALFLVVALAWAANRRREGLLWDMPSHISLLLWLSLFVVFFGFLRAVLDRSHIEMYTVEDLVSEHLINTIKWFLPALLLYDGCRTRSRTLMAMGSIFIMYLLIAALVIRRMPMEALYAYSESVQLSRLKLHKAVGYHAVDTSAFLAGAFWAVIAFLQLIRQKKYQLLALGAGGVILIGQALTGGRGGFLAWGCTGLTMCVLKWRRYLLAVPVAAILLPVLFPGPTERMLLGFGQRDVTGEETVDTQAVGSGRLQVWPYVIEEIGKSPWIGYGRLAMRRIGLTRRVGLELGDDTWPHPHNMYLAFLLDNGILGSVPVFLFWGIMLLCSGRLFMSRNRLYSAVGGATLAIILCQLYAGIGGQHFYPRESTLATYAAMFLAFRVYMEEKRLAIEVERAAEGMKQESGEVAVA